METKNIDNILKEIKEIISSDDLEKEDYKNEISSRISKIETIRKKENKYFLMFIVFLFTVVLFVSAYSLITYDSQNDLKQNVEEKSKIIDKYEKVVKNVSSPNNGLVYTDNRGNVVTMNQLIDDNFELMQKIDDYKFKLDFIKEVYGIEIIKNKNSYGIKATKVDSALLLLNTYKDKLKFDPIKKQWIISRTYIDTVRVKK